MSEEIRNRNNELNEAALEQVSGGASEYMHTHAHHICADCFGRGDSRICEGGEEQLAEYFNEGRNFISDWHHCPYLKT